MGKADQVSSIVLLFLGIFVVFHSYRFGLGQLFRPGAGFVPFLCGVILSGLSVFIFLREQLTHKSRDRMPIKQIWLGVSWEGITFKGSAEAVTACLGGHVDVVSQNPNDVASFIKAGRLRLLASLSLTRWEWVPDMPTVRELGYDLAIEGWYGLAAPKASLNRFLTNW
jgi:hypothetical protein